MQGLLATLDSNGNISLGYLGTSVSKLRIAHLESRPFDFDGVQSELEQLQRQARELLKGAHEIIVQKLLISS
jgi:hypothetical protein